MLAEGKILSEKGKMLAEGGMLAEGRMFVEDRMLALGMKKQKDQQQDQ